MKNIVDKNQLELQYQNDNNLAIRAAFHQKYNTNKIDLGDWFFTNLSITAGLTILELGSGNGRIWKSQLENLPESSQVVLSDFSEGMVAKLQQDFRTNRQIDVQRIDIQSIPYEDHYFDLVIANHTLHHVPDISKALSEVSRVLKPDGAFYCLANGTEGLENYLHQVITTIEPDSMAFKENLPFNLQNGCFYLNQHFNKIEIIPYENSLAVTKTADLIAWIHTTRTMQPGITDELLGKLTDYFEQLRLSEGIIRIPKQIGLFIAKKPKE